MSSAAASRPCASCATRTSSAISELSHGAQRLGACPRLPGLRRGEVGRRLARLPALLDGAADPEREVEVQRCRHDQRQPPPTAVLAEDAGEDDEPDTT